MSRKRTNLQRVKAILSAIDHEEPDINHQNVKENHGSGLLEKRVKEIPKEIREPSIIAQTKKNKKKEKRPLIDTTRLLSRYDF